MIGTLRMALAARLNDKDDFKQLVLTSDDGSSRVSFHINPQGEFICELDGSESIVSDERLFDSIEDYVRRGYSKITCEGYSGNVNIEVSPDGKMKINYVQPPNVPETANTEYLIDPEEAGDLLEAIEITNAEGAMTLDMRRKYVQIDNFVRLVHPLLDISSQTGKIFILDCGAGKSYLSFFMNYYLREKLRRRCHFFCIDTNAELIEKCQLIKEKLNYGNMEFHVSRIRDFQPDEKIDIVCSLHACDTATDEAIAKAIQLDAPFLLAVPCCQHEVTNQLKEHPLKAITRHGVYKSKLTDLLTDAMRTLILESAGYKVKVTEYISPIYTPKNVMIQAEKIQSRNKMALEQYLELKSMFGDISIELERMLPELFN